MLQQKSPCFLNPYHLPCDNISLGEFVANNKDELLMIRPSLSTPDLKTFLPNDGTSDKTREAYSHRYSILVHLDRSEYMRRLNINLSEVRSSVCT